MTNPQIRLAQSTDLDQLRAVELAAATRFASVGMQALVDHAEPVPLTVLQQGQAEERLWVAVAGASVVGFALASQIDTDAYLDEIDVLPEWGGRGIGRALIAAASAWAVQQQLKRLTLVTFRTVPWNAPWYQRLGFRELPLAELPAPLRSIWQAEARHGFDPASRIVLWREADRTHAH